MAEVKDSIVSKKLAYWSVLTIVLVASFIVVRIYTQNTHQYTDILHGHDWAHMSGANVTQIGVKITPLNQNIIHQDGSKAQLNPPVNVRGPHIEFSGDFEVKATMSDMGDGASLQLYGQVPIVYDEWRQERPSIRVDVSSTRLEARIWDGNASTPMDIRSYNLDKHEDVVLGITRIKGKIILTLDGRTLGSMPDHAIFSSGTIWFGADGSDKGNGWILRDLQARPVAKSTLQVIDAPQSTTNRSDPGLLRNLAEKLPKKIQMGVAVSANQLFTDERYKNIVASEFNLVTLESSLKPQFLHPAKNTYDFTDADNIVAFAKANDQGIHGHTLVFAKSNPSWMTDTPDKDLPEVMTSHITQVVEHFKGQIGTWDVVNEPLSEKDEDYVNGGLGLRTSLWQKAMGEAYIDKAFIAARKADPTAKLYLNDYGIEHNGQRWDALLALLQRLQARGVPIDGVGFESHVYQTPDKINFDTLRSHIQVLANLGFSVRISEIDVTGKDPQFQSEQYAGVLAVCMAEPSCTAYSTWGVSDLYGSTTISDRYPLLLGSSLLWDKNMDPKPALNILRNTLRRAE